MSPAVSLFALVWAIANGNVRMGIGPVELRWFIDRIQMVFLSGLYLLRSLVPDISSTGAPTIRSCASN